MIDLHCHLDLYPDARNLAREVASRNLFTLVVTTSPRAWRATSAVFRDYTNIKVGLGLHPEVAEQKANERWDLVELVGKSRFIGEIGLDGSPRFRSSLELQISILEDALAECERHDDRILSLHSRGATSTVLDQIARYPAAGKVILHWFSGTQKELERAIELGCWFSIGPAMLASEKGQQLAKNMPIERVLPETDGPFATRAGIALMPWQAIDIVWSMASAWRIREEELRERLRANLAALLNHSCDSNPLVMRRSC